MAGFFAVVFRLATFRAGDFRAGDLRVVVFFFVAVFLFVAGFLAAVFLFVAGFLAAVFLFVAGFLAAVFLFVAGFLASGFLLATRTGERAARDLGATRLAPGDILELRGDTIRKRRVVILQVDQNFLKDFKKRFL